MYEVIAYRHELNGHLCPAPNVWVGVSVESQKHADERVPLLMKTPAEVKFLSVEPLLEAVDIRDYLNDGEIDWVICGGESGPGSRPFNLQWAEFLLEQCNEFSVNFFMKQMGSAPHSDSHRISHRGDPLPHKEGFWRYLNDRKGGNMSEWPEHLRVREFPRV